MFKIIKTLFIIIWLVDICNLNITINGVSYLTASMLDVDISINFWFWFIFWLLVPSSDTFIKERS